MIRRTSSSLLCKLVWSKAVTVCSSCMTSAKRFLPSFTLFSAFFFLLPQTI